ncbi:MAG: HlyD family efflux transporter periplasmic adaptor subunit [Alphaproteobacteria bacterium]|nr:HlyD family efflux transporter periplasmic adaptor subunit [Alphaproteobacteria bacterium]
MLQLQSEARLTESLETFGFVVVNQTQRLLPCRVAVLWLGGRHGGRGDVQAISGVPYPDKDAPAVRWFMDVARKAPEGDGPRALTAADFHGASQDEWTQWSPSHVLWLPLAVTKTEKPLGGLWLAREEPWTQNEIILAAALAEGYSETLHRHRIGHAWQRLEWNRLRVGAGALVMLLVAGVIPVRLSVLAPAEVVPLDPVVVTSPREGVISGFQVVPNEPVSLGQPLFHLEDTEVRAKHDLAEKTLAVAVAEFRKASQAAFGDKDSMADKAILQARIDKTRADVTYAAELLSESKVLAAKAGIAIFTYDDWLGKPVRVGERILTIADPARVEVLIWLPVADAIVVAPGAEVRLFLNTAPLNSLSATMRTSSYEAVPNADRIVAYKLKATLASDVPPPRIGLKGTARVYGKNVPLIWLLLRRPVAALRQLVGV